MIKSLINGTAHLPPIGPIAMLVFLSIACHQKAKPDPEGNHKRDSDSQFELDPAYARDVDRFCFAERHAGALDIETTARGMVVADWLGKNLETAEARKFLLSLQKLSATEKAKRLRSEGQRAKLADCPTAAAWEKAASLH